MGQKFSKDVVMMFQNHDKEVGSYVIFVHVPTGKRVVLDLNDAFGFTSGDPNFMDRQRLET
jgi:hypothetical protein